MTERTHFRLITVKALLLLLCSGIYLPGQILAASCSEGVAEPPFLSYGRVDPNVLLIIDNSASMYDMAYLEDAAYCFDDNYTLTSNYAGYFDPETYYQYNSAADRFEETGGSTAYSICNSAAPGTVYHSNGADADSSHACITIDESVEPTSLTVFAAKGNFLNWATSSKFDVEKNILTGGKHDDNNTLIMENRGCANRRFLKQIGLADGSNLTLAIRTPIEEETAYSGDNTTRIEIFPVTETGFDNSSCQLAVEELQKDSPNQGQFKQYVDDCMGYESGGGSDPLDNRHATFNHSLHYCWYLSRHGEWPPGVGSVNSIQNDCELVYNDGGLPPTITPDNRSYVCYGIYDAETPHDERAGYVGRCWEPETTPEGCTAVTCTDPDGDGDPTNDVDVLPQAEDNPYHEPFCGEDGHVYYCDGNFNENQGTCVGSPGVFRMKVIEEEEGDCDEAAITQAGWTDDMDTATCIEQALRDYCGSLEVPEVVDPSDLASQSGEFWNLPAVLIDSGSVAQIDEPVAVLKGHVARDSAPSGLLQEVSGDLRLGAMTFNDDGAASECTDNDKISCKSGSMDGGRVIAEIADSNATGHVDQLIESINDIKALSWTPLAEAMYNAIGYYGQDTSRRLNVPDFNATCDPVNYWCQNNNILILTDGASTTDLHQDLQNFVGVAGQNDGDNDDNASCEPLSGSTFLDDLAYYARQSNASSLYTTPQLNEEDKRNIKTYLVSSGSLRSTGNDECSPDILMQNTALSGGTSLFSSEDPQELGNNLRLIFSEITTKASSGSAASVISSSRSGEGALYQAIFWPSKEPESDSFELESISWT
ncbi:MAG: hypothetical protein ACQES8_04070, partial [Thermodesulfobacteriota bacterium]